MRIGLCFVVFWWLTVSVAADDTIRVVAPYYLADASGRICVVNADAVETKGSREGNISHILLDKLYSFELPQQRVGVGKEYQLYATGDPLPYTLFLTRQPLINITTRDEIRDEEYVPAQIRVINTNGSTLESYAGIQLRGKFTQTLPKKSMEIEFWNDSTGTSTRDVSFAGMVNDDDWNLQALYNEPLRVRSVASFDLWRKINSLHYYKKEPQAVNGVRMSYVELMVNGRYLGLYALGEKVKRKQLQLKKYNGTIRGELYKGVDWGGASTFTALEPFSNTSPQWSGMELKYPTEVIDWSNLYQLVDFVVTTDDAVFIRDYEKYFDPDNLVDYFIFLNVLRATDNLGKNVYLARYDADSPYFFVPWDLDGSFGNNWDGTPDENTRDILKTGLFKRLMYDCRDNGFRDRLRSRWQELRQHVLSPDSLKEQFGRTITFLANDGAYRREAIAWSGYSHSFANVQYLYSWIDERIIYLDKKFTENCYPVAVETVEADQATFRVYTTASGANICIEAAGEENADILIFNRLGQTVVSTHSSTFPYLIPSGHLEAGLYFVRIEGIRHTHTFKLIR